MKLRSQEDLHCKPFVAAAASTEATMRHMAINNALHGDKQHVTWQQTTHCMVTNNALHGDNVLHGDNPSHGDNASHGDNMSHGGMHCMATMRCMATMQLDATTANRRVSHHRCKATPQQKWCRCRQVFSFKFLSLDLFQLSFLYSAPEHSWELWGTFYFYVGKASWLFLQVLKDFLGHDRVIYKTKICWNKGGVPLFLSVVRLVFWVYSPSSLLPDYRLFVTGPRCFTRVRFVCKGVPLKQKDLFIHKALYGWFLTSTTLQRNHCSLLL